MSRVKISPSILSADFTRLGDQVREAELAGADWIHLDVMDGHFVPNITIGPMVAAAVRRCTSLTLDVHLMIEQPERYLGAFADAGADYLTVHVETCPHLHRTVEQIRDLGMKPGVTLNPATPVEALAEILPYLDLVLVMSVNPGFGGQSYIPTSTRKIAKVRKMLDESGRGDVELEVDGGVAPDTIVEIWRAGASAVVAGAAVFNTQGSIAENIRRLRTTLEESDVEG